MLKDLIIKDSVAFKRLCVDHHVATLHAFGSSVHGPFTATSDVDLIVDIDTKDPLTFGEHMLNLWDNLELFFGRKVTC